MSETSAAGGTSVGRDPGDDDVMDVIEVEETLDALDVDDAVVLDDAVVVDDADEANVVDAGASADDTEAGAPAVAEPEPVPVPVQASDPVAGGSPQPSSPQAQRALAELAGLAELDLADQPDTYQRIHRELQDALTSIDDA